MYKLLAAGALILALIAGAWGAVQHYRTVVMERDMARDQLLTCQSANDTLSETIDEYEREAERAIADAEAAAERADGIEAERERERAEASRQFAQLRRQTLTPDECGAARVPDDRLRLLDNAASGG